MSSLCHICIFIFLVIFLIVPGSIYGMQLSGPSEIEFPYNDRPTLETTEATQSHTIHRKFLSIGLQCAERDIRISQSLESTHGIPTFAVQIMNTCTAECAPREIHLHCGEFASARMVNPLTFKRISNDDCLVNGGEPLEAGQIVRFAYYNTYQYPLSFKSAKFSCEK